MSKLAKPDAWMPLYIGDYKKDTGRLTTELHGAYLLLIMEYWSTGPLVDDDDELAAITVSSPREWKRMRPKIARFFVVADGFWRHKRIDEELDKWSTRKAAAVERARKGGAARAASSSKNRSLKHPTSSSQAVLKGCSSSSSTVEDTPNSVSSHSGRDAHAERAGGSPSPRAWPGPADFRAAVVEMKGEDFTASWLDHTSWQDVPERAIICRLGVTAQRLNNDLRKLLAAHGIVVKTERAA